MRGTVVSVEDRDRDPYRFDAGRAVPVIVIETASGIERVEWRRAGPPPSPGEQVAVEQTEWYDDERVPEPA